jgi:hypothetical protein
MQDIRRYFERVEPGTVVESHEMWLGAVDTLLSELSDVHSVSSRLKFEERASACEKVRSILLHSLWKCCVESGKTSPSEIFECFDDECHDLFDSARKVGEAKRKRMLTSGSSTGGTISDADALGLLISKYKFVPFLDVNWVQGCEFDVVVICAPSVDGRKYPEAPRTRKLFIERSLSRTKLLSVSVIPARTEQEARTYWPGPWHDWSRFSGLSWVVNGQRHL